MGKGELNEFERGKIIGLRIAGRTHKAIARLLKIPKSTVTDTITWHANSNNGSNAKRTGRPPSIHQTLKKIIKKNNQSSLSISEIYHNFQNLKKSFTNIIHELHQMGIHSRMAAQKPLLTESQRENRLKWCMERQNWSIQNGRQ